MIRLIVGLGNPGKEYEATRHNFGRLVVEALAAHEGIVWRKWHGQAVAKVDSQLSLMLPETYMNRSGEAVSQFAEYFSIDTDEILIVADELDLPLGRFELKRGGHHAGHRGLESIIGQLGTNDIWRLRLGIGRPSESREPDAVASYVLSRFKPEEQTIVTSIIDETVSLLLESRKTDLISQVRTVSQVKE